MKLSEITQNTDADMEWLMSVCNLHPNNIRVIASEDGPKYHVKTNIDIQKPNVLASGFPVNIVSVAGSLTVYSAAADSVTSLETFPRVIASGFCIDYANITTFKGLPQCVNLWADGISKPTIADLFSNIRWQMDCLSYSGHRIDTFVGIHDIIKYPIKKLWLVSAQNAEGGIGFILVPGLQELHIECRGSDEAAHKAAWRIINKYLGRPDDIFDCQAELIENGFDKYAIL